ncbi:MAG TPA: RDD family protein [Candidatus Limnocylindrales bacterium]|nr:RDD family protein [Candidatus Limnocylindrales bacterium]
MDPVPTSPAAPPAAASNAVPAVADHVRYAHPIRRLVAYLVDGLVVAGLIFVAGSIATVILGPTVRFDVDGPDGLVLDRSRAVVNAILGTAISALYFVASWTRAGRTPGQALCNLRVAAVGDGSRLSVRDAVVRWVALGAPVALVSLVVRGSPAATAALTLAAAGWSAVLLVTTIFERRHRGLHDRLARSIVIRESGETRRRVTDLTQ